MEQFVMLVESIEPKLFESVEMIFKLIYLFTQTIIWFIFSYELPIVAVERTGRVNTVRRLVQSLRLNPLSVPKPRTSSCYLKSKIIDCKLLHDTSLLRTLNVIEYSRAFNEFSQKFSSRLLNQYPRNTKESTATQKVQAKNAKAKFEHPGETRKLLWNIINNLLPQQTATHTNGSVKVKKTMRRLTMYNAFIKSHESFDRKLYNSTFNKLLQICPKDRKVNGISFVESGLFLQLLLIALTDEVGPASKAEIEKCVGLQLSKSHKLFLLNKIITQLPVSNNDIKFHWSYRLVLWPGANVGQSFGKGSASALQMHIDRFNGTERPEQIVTILNKMIESDSGGAIRDTFQEEDVSDGVDAVVLNTLYLRARWRSAPTMLNGSRPFRDAADARQRTIRMIRINDRMRYADITELNAEAVEIFYATEGLSLLLLVPRNQSLQSLAARAVATSVDDIVQRMHTVRIAAILPVYTLRMTLLLPNKLQAMGITQIFNSTSDDRKSLKVSHAVQRLMFWAEAGRNAFKDDGIEWDESPEFELIVDSPYIFYVRWNNMTLMNGNFVL